METEFLHIPIKKPLAGPAMKAAISFMAGILITESIHINPLTCLVCAWLGVLLLIVFYRTGKIGSFMAITVMFFSGMLVCSAYHMMHKPLHIPDNLMNQTVYVEGITVDDTRIYDGNTRFTMRCHTLHADTITYRESGLLPCFLYDKTISLPEGSRIVVQGKIKHYRRPFTRRITFWAHSMHDFTQSLVTASSMPDPIIIETGKSIFGSIRNHLFRMIDLYHFGGHRDLLRAITFADK